MKVSFPVYRPALRLNKTNNASYHKNYTPLQDTVSFSGKINPANLSQNEQKGLTVTKQLIALQKEGKLNLVEISQVFNSSSPVPIGVHSLYQMPPQISKQLPPTVIAHMLPGYRPSDLTLARADIYLREARNASLAGDVIANASHEFVHVLQRHADTSYYGIKNYTDDVQSLTTVSRTAQSIYQRLIIQGEKALGQNAEFNRRLKARPEFSIADISRYLEKQGVFKNIDSDFAQMSQDALQGALGYVLLQDPKLRSANMPELLKKWVKQHCDMEVEAYNVTINALKRYGKVNPDILTARSVTRAIHGALSKIL